jgi:hypothetical protein
MYESAGIPNKRYNITEQKLHTLQQENEKMLVGKLITEVT